MNVWPPTFGFGKKRASAAVLRIGSLPVLIEMEPIRIGPGRFLAKIIQPAVLRAGIYKKVGWHTHLLLNE